MKFKDFKYERPCYDQNKIEMSNIIKEINKSDSFNKLISNINKLNNIRNNIESMSTLSSIRYSINTSDTYYEKEKQYWDEYLPLYEELNTSFYKSIINSRFKDQLEEHYGKQFIKICDYSIKAFSSDIIEDLQEENKLCSKYTKLLASAKLNFEGEEKNLSELMKFMSDKDRSIRQKSSNLYYRFFEINEDKFDEIFDDLVKVRDKIAKKLGYVNFIELGYLRMKRTDYDYKMVEIFRQQVKDLIVPLASDLYKRQAKRIGINKLTYIDENFEYKNGNASLKINSDEIISNGKKMYSELSRETNEFINFMISNELMDLETKKYKASGGYCTYIPNYNSPFIFSNFNQTSEDIDVLTHEAGHAFQLYMSKHINMPELNFPTYDSCEIHSMGMEFITWKWMDLYFKEDTDKYKFTHMSSAVKFIPYGVLVDKFQHIIYEKPNMTKVERKNAWINMEKEYLPHKNYNGYDFLERGCWWFKQGHIFKNPFYYIDYTLAQICSIQLWKQSQGDFNTMWSNYLEMCKVGGTKSFLEIVKIGKLNSPFEKGCVESIIDEIKSYLNGVDDIKL